MFGAGTDRLQAKVNSTDQYDRARLNIEGKVEAKDHFTTEEKTALKRLEKSALDGDIGNLQYYMRELKGKPYAQKLMAELGKDLNELGISTYARVENGNPKITLTDKSVDPATGAMYQIVISTDQLRVYSKRPEESRFGADLDEYAPTTMIRIAEQIRKKASR